MYPDKSVLERCAMMHDSGARTPKLLEMWARVKGDDVPLWNLAVIVVSFGVLLVLGIRRKMQKRISHRRQRKANPKRKK